MGNNTDAGTGLVEALAKTFTGGSIVDAAKGALNRITGKKTPPPDGEDDDVDSGRKQMVDSMNKAAADARAKRAQDAFVASKTAAKVPLTSTKTLGGTKTGSSKTAQSRRRIGKSE